MTLMNAIFITLAAFLVLFGLVALGLAVRPRPYRPHPVPSRPGAPAPYAQELPPPVRRHFIDTIGETTPGVESAIVWGRGSACIRGVWLPMRFKAWYLPGRAFMRRLEMTFFLRPVLRAVDRYASGKGVVQLGADVDEGPHVDDNQFRSLWAEAVWMPALFVHNPAIRWEAIDDNSARLVVPSGSGAAEFTAHFDPLTGRMTHLETTRQTEDGLIEPLRMDLLAWKEFHGVWLPNQVSIAEGESGSPGSYWNVEGVVYNASVSDQLGEEAG